MVLFDSGSRKLPSRTKYIPCQLLSSASGLLRYTTVHHGMANRTAEYTEVTVQMDDYSTLDASILSKVDL